MRISRRVVLYKVEEILEICAAGGHLNERGVLVVAEDEPQWPDVSRALDRLNLTAATSTEFNSKERAEAKYLELSSEWFNGYPQPEDSYLESIFDTSAMCTECGIGLVQTAPFRLKKLPNWGRRSFFILFWTSDVVFVRSEVYERIFKPIGVEVWPVLLHKTGAVLEDVVQLKPMEQVHVSINGLKIEKCPTCGVDKYNWQTRGFQPKPLQATAPVISSLEWFGSGASSGHMLMVSHEIYEQIKDLKGAALTPCAS